MNRVAVAVACAVVLGWAASARAEEDGLTLTRVVLSTGGVGYFEYRAEVDGDGTLALDVPLEQVDDVLKSVVVFDAAGNVGRVELPGREPLGQVFRDLPFDSSALGSPVALLAALQGAEIELAGARTLRGRVLSVVAEAVALPDGLGVTERHRIALVTDQGLAQAILEETDRITFLDAELGQQVAAALGAVATHRVRDRRTLEVLVEGEGRREVTVGYVVGVPLWKASYRMVLPAAGEAEGKVQGWAHIENMSGRDWDGVDLTLVSGNPVTFHQALYEAYYVARPEIPVEVAGRVLPRLDQGTVALLAAKEEAIPLQRAAAESDELRKLADMAVSETFAAEPAPPEAAAAPDLYASYDVRVGAEAATQVAFHIAEPVSVGDGNSLMVPIVQAALPMERLALYQPATHPRHPEAAVRLSNGGEAGLPPGVATLYEKDGAGATVFVGDARVPALPAGEERFLSYALDQKTIVDREDGYAQAIGRIKAHDGVFEIETIERQTTTYRVAAPAHEARRVVIEHPRMPGWTLAAPEGEGVELTDTDHRVPVSLAAGTERTLDVVLEHVTWQQVAIADVDADMIEIYATDGMLEPDARKALESLFDLRRQVERAREALLHLDERRARLFEDQDRIRENLERVPQGGDLARQYLAKLAQQEAALGRLERDYEAARDELAALEAALAERIAALTID